MQRIVKLRYFMLGLLVLYGVLLVPTPYIVYEPGSASAVHPMVQVAGGRSANQEGSLLLTTVKLTYKANAVKYIQAMLDPNLELHRKEELFKEGENPAEFAQKQTYSMLSSQSDAILAAYELLQIPYDVKSIGIMVLATEEGMPAEEVLKPGDWIQEAEGQSVRTMAELREIMRDREIGDTVRWTIKREGEERAVELTLADYQKVMPSLERPTPGLGFSMSEIRDIVPDDEQLKVKIASGAIGGPSAGLMFTLEILDQLLPEDLTHGQVIAGTGVIGADGKVGPIGGIGPKVVAADREGADTFFSPKANEAEARRKAEAIGTKMEIVAVDTAADALEYLRGL